MSMFSEFLKSVASNLSSSGITDPATLTKVFSGLSQLNPASPVLGLCNQILANAANPKVVDDLATKIAETPGVPASVIAILPALSNPAATPLQVIQAVQAIETALGAGQSGLLGFNVGGLHF